MGKHEIDQLLIVPSLCDVRGSCQTLSERERERERFLEKRMGEKILIIGKNMGLHEW
jgi:hypothetical protein